MFLIADSGSTKTEWSLVSNDSKVSTYITSGINPYYQDSEQIVSVLQSELQIVDNIESIWFYGAGCANVEKNSIVEQALRQCFNAKNVFIASDLLGAAVALCGSEKGIVSILGTGSNSCYYDGTNIIHNVSPLGFILGDEGSGAVIGKKFIANVLKKQFSSFIIDRFLDEYKITAAQIVEAVYRQPFPNRYLAKFTHFVSANIHNEELSLLVESCFDEFVVRNLHQYPCVKELPIHFTGSVAYYFKPQLINVFKSRGLILGKVELSPMKGLLDYYIDNKVGK